MDFSSIDGIAGRSRANPTDNVDRTESPAAAALQIANPPTGATYLIDPTLRPEFQTLALRVVAARPGQVEWRVDGQSIGAVFFRVGVSLAAQSRPASHRGQRQRGQDCRNDNHSALTRFIAPEGI